MSVDIDQRLAFLVELEKLKAVLRQTRPVGLDRRENSAEHSWHTTMAALIFMPDHLDALKVLKMLLIHDVVEIDTGDVFVYDEAAREAIAEKEAMAARRLFGMLPETIGTEMLALWEEFESRSSPEAAFAKAMDRVCPVLQNVHGERSSWADHGISRQRALAKNEEIGSVLPPLWGRMRALIEEAEF